MESKDTRIAQLESQVFGLEKMCADYAAELEKARNEIRAYELDIYGADAQAVIEQLKKELSKKEHWHNRSLELEAKLKQAEKVIAERGYAFQEAQNKTLLKNADLAAKLEQALRERDVYIAIANDQGAAIARNGKQCISLEDELNAAQEVIEAAYKVADRTRKPQEVFADHDDLEAKLLKYKALLDKDKRD